jgi:hypothetical protein
MTRHRNDPTPIGIASVMIGPWMDGYRETHLLHVNGERRIFIVRNWLGLSGPEGVLLSADESNEVWQEFNRLRTFYAAFQKNKVATGVFAINDGPFLAALNENGTLGRNAAGRPDLVISSISDVVDVPDYFLPLVIGMDSAVIRQDTGNPSETDYSLYWAQPKRALEAFVQGILDRATYGIKPDLLPAARRQAIKRALHVLRRTQAYAAQYEHMPSEQRPFLCPYIPG